MDDTRSNTYNDKESYKSYKSGSYKPRNSSERDERHRGDRRDSEERPPSSPNRADGDVWDHSGWEEREQQQSQRRPNRHSYETRGRNRGGRPSSGHSIGHSRSHDTTSTTQLDGAGLETISPQKSNSSSAVGIETKEKTRHPDRLHYTPPRGKYSSAVETAEPVSPAPEEASFRRDTDNRAQSGNPRSADRRRLSGSGDRKQTEQSPKFNGRNSGDINPESGEREYHSGGRRNSRGRASGSRNRRFSQEKTVIMVLNIAIGDREELLSVCEGDDPNELSKEFCDKHNIGDKYLGYIADQIETNVKRISGAQAQEGSEQGESEN
ncbi:hypothetical protein PROFUN_12086 [Planoprotostelium fungivorum]|uniref:Uncharacterized protein n=1 Tax=Planoprotostelium fungivorum TaxID=1890364 RepID=A0A2P6N8R0_9EUKA|nr:hypothetical protein PROFUN_12086 [Planoprotostelium fungivorum]